MAKKKSKSILNMVGKELKGFGKEFKKEGKGWGDAARKELLGKGKKKK